MVPDGRIHPIEQGRFERNRARRERISASLLWCVRIDLPHIPC
jgi:hypothetical protein